MKYIFSWGTVCIYSLFIIFISVIPVKCPELGVSFFDKIVHFLIYFFLVALTVNTLLLRKNKYIYIVSFSYAFFLGIIVECTQFFIPYRSFELNDIIYNCLGSFAGLGIRINNER